jgi:hypothetical protein
MLVYIVPVSVQSVYTLPLIQRCIHFTPIHLMHSIGYRYNTYQDCTRLSFYLCTCLLTYYYYYILIYWHVIYYYYYGWTKLHRGQCLWIIGSIHYIWTRANVYNCSICKCIHSHVYSGWITLLRRQRALYAGSYIHIILTYIRTFIFKRAACTHVARLVQNARHARMLRVRM